LIGFGLVQKAFVLLAMRDILGQCCGDLVGAYVNASLKRDYDAREIYLFLEERQRRDRRLLRRRIVKLEQERSESQRSIEDLVEEVERLNAALNRMRASPVESVGLNFVCEPAVEAQPAAIVLEEAQSAGEDWTQI
jgi:hypothetical protein